MENLDSSDGRMETPSDDAVSEQPAVKVPKAPVAPHCVKERSVRPAGMSTIDLGAKIVSVLGPQ